MSILKRNPQARWATNTASTIGLGASPDSKWVMTGSRDGTIIVWDAERGKVIYEWLAHWGRVRALGFSPDSKRLVSAGGSSGETLVVWDISHGVRKVAVLATIDGGNTCEQLLTTASGPPTAH